MGVTKTSFRCSWWRLLAGVGVLSALPLLPAAASAQEFSVPLLRTDPDDRSAVRVVAGRRSQFDLTAASDMAYTGMRMVGTFMYSMSNSGPGDHNYNPYYFGYLNHRGGWRHNFFEITLMAGVPRSTWLRYRDTHRSLQNIRNQDGYNAFMNANLLTDGAVVNFRGADGTLGELFSGVTSTRDGTCRDHGATQAGQLTANNTLLPGSNCRETWGPAGWRGSAPILGGTYAELYRERGSSFSFDWWRVPEEERAPGFIGNFQTYGQISDFYLERLRDFGSVVPGGQGAPIKDGYPLGLEINFDAFSFTLPTVSNAVFWQATIVNRSDKVYGHGGMDYDSLYVGFSPQPSNTIQETSTYFEPWSGAIRWVNIGVNPGCNGKPGYCNTAGDRGFFWGATEMLILNSPIGDLRNKHFSNPSSPFFNPVHPHAGDTITFNHGHACGYGPCTDISLLAARDRRRFGLLASSEVNLLDGRSLQSLSDAEVYYTFRPKSWPVRSGFNRYVPGNWSYSNRPPGAPPGPDTLFLDSCAGSGPPSVGCVRTFADTLTHGRTNYWGNAQVVGIGPFPLEVGDTTKITIAILGARDSLGIETLHQNVIDLYMGFFLGPQAPPSPAIVATHVLPGSVQENEVTLFLDDRSEEWVDPFLTDYHRKLMTAPPGSELERLRRLNPWLADSIRARASDNVAALYVYRSCTGGTTWTASADCRADIATDAQGNPSGNGWRPAFTLRPGTGGRFANSITDFSARPGVTYTYSIAAESRGATFLVLDSINDQLAARSLEVAPRLIAPLASAVSEPHVARVFVPISTQAGGALAEATVFETGQRGRARVPFNPLSVRVAGVPAAADTFRVVFADSFTVRRTQALSLVYAYRHGQREVFLGAGGEGVTVSGGLAPTTAGDTTIFRVNTLGVLVLRANGSIPLLVSGDIAGDPSAPTTPGTFIARGDFPNFILNVDNSRAGQFDRAFYLSPAGDTILPAGAPTLNWRSTRAVRRSPAGAGEYVITWTDRAYGANAPFTINFADPDATGQVVSASLSGRAVGQTGLVSQEALEAVKATVVAEYSATAFGQAARVAAEALTVDDLIAVKLPFTVRNISFDRPVGVVMLKRTTRARLDALAASLDPEGVLGRIAEANTITLGADLDVQRGIPIPADTWVSSDRLYLVEQVDGRLTNTFSSVTVHCATDPAIWCNPVRGRGSSPYVSPQAGQKLIVRYYVPFDADSEFLFEVRPAVSGRGVTVTQGDLDEILFVPNPYLGRSGFEQGGSREAVAYFTGMPAEGVVRIYTVSGQFVQEIRWSEQDLLSGDFTRQERTRASGDLRWDLRTREGNELAAGLYVFVIESAGLSKLGKFVVIR